MTNRELLELAARAAGIEGKWSEWDHAYGDYREHGIDYGGRTLWNPLDDDGDAFCLACDLGLRVFPVARTESGAACSAVGAVTGERLSEVADTLPTRIATRRAIVRAAAEIGRSMK